MVPQRVRLDPRVALHGSAELRLVYPQICKLELAGPDHVGAIVAVAELLGPDPRAVATRVLAEMRTLELTYLLPNGAQLSAHAPPPRLPPSLDPKARERELGARRNHLKAARERGDTRPAAVVLAEYVYRSKGARPPSPRRDDSTPPLAGGGTPFGTPSDPPVDPPGTPRSTPPLEGREENEDGSSSSSSSDPRETEGKEGTDTARARPPHPPPRSDARTERHTPPGGEGGAATHTLDWPVVAGVLGGGPQGVKVFGLKVPREAQERLVGHLEHYAVTRAQLVEMARLGREAKLREMERGVVFDLARLAPRSGDTTLLCSWLNTVEASLARHRGLELGLPQNQPALRTGAEAPPASTGPPGEARAELAPTREVDTSKMAPVTAAAIERVERLRAKASGDDTS